MATSVIDICAVMIRSTFAGSAMSILTATLKFVFQNHMQKCIEIYKCRGFFWAFKQSLLISDVNVLEA
jgi:hypothetical protein